MVKSRSFKSKKSSGAPEKIYFELDDRKFNCLPKRSGAVVLDAIARITGGEGGVSQVANVVPFLTSSVVPEEREEFTKVINDDSNPIDFDVLIEVMSFLLESYTSRPTKELSPSEDNS